MSSRFHGLRLWILGLCLIAMPLTAVGEALRPAIVLNSAVNREGRDLSGLWSYSLDLYLSGFTDINDKPAKSRMERFREVDVAALEKTNPNTFYEFDMGRGPRMMIPGAWNAQKPELRYYDGLIWFQRKFTPDVLNGRRAFLYFEAINYKAFVYLNGKRIGQHEGGFTPFAIEVTDSLRAGENQITIGVNSTHDAKSVPPSVTDWDLYGGITRAVRLIYTPQTYIDDAKVELTPKGRITSTVALSGKESAGKTVTLSIKSLGIRVNATADASGEARFDLKAPGGLKRWSPDSPTLYDVQISTDKDVWQDRIGFRTIEVKGTDILLNGKPIYLRGISMHEEELGANPARRITYASAKALLSEIKYGLNGNYVRLSHYPHSEITTRLADEMGLLVWSEIPVYWAVDFANPQALMTARKMLAENIYRDHNRASVIIWSIANETPVSDPRNSFLFTLADDVKRLDPSRLVSAALLVERKIVDGHIDITIEDPLVDRLDIMAANTYNGWYGDDKLEALPATRWHAPVKKPLILSEFGADALAGTKVDGGAVPFKFSEDYQAQYYRQTLAMADQIPFLRGMSPWILKDFQSPRREHPVYQNGWNRKGLISETGVRKEAFGVLSAYYQKQAAKAQ
jgi:beta-glucuronidase